ncbi:hypothetical protein LXA43DRAFT_895912 [Ganoderma leucocontextum]|nr:hypothetical protein LXA43DRAFT_895912 [Ganoderma leucocontextum]
MQGAFGELEQDRFRTHLGPNDAGFLAMAKRRGGGYYLDVSASQLLIDGNIKLKSGSAIKRFTKTGLEFEDGSTVDADVIMFATGCVSFSLPFGSRHPREDVAARVKPMWGLDEEGELRNAWRDTGVPNFWFIMGNLMLCRFHSKHLALRECLSLSGFLFSSWHLLLDRLQVRLR